MDFARLSIAHKKTEQRRKTDGKYCTNKAPIARTWNREAKRSEPKIGPEITIKIVGDVGYFFRDDLKEYADDEIAEIMAANGIKNWFRSLRKQWTFTAC